MFDYQTGVDPAFDPRIGVGVECTGYCLEDAIQRGFKEYDFGGGTQAYKLRWTDQLQNTVNVRIARCSWKESIYSTLVSARTALRTLKHRLRPATSATLIPAGTKEE